MNYNFPCPMNVFFLLWVQIFALLISKKFYVYFAISDVMSQLFNMDNISCDWRFCVWDDTYMYCKIKLKLKKLTGKIVIQCITCVNQNLIMFFATWIQKKRKERKLKKFIKIDHCEQE